MSIELNSKERGRHGVDDDWLSHDAHVRRPAGSCARHYVRLNGAGTGQAAAASPGRQLAATSDVLVVLHAECSMVYPVLQKIKC